VQNYDSNRQVASGRVIWAASGPPPLLGAWADAHMDGACSVIVALKSRTLRQHQKIFLPVVLMSETFPPWAALFLSAALSLSLTLKYCLGRVMNCKVRIDGWMDACLLACTTTSANGQLTAAAPVRPPHTSKLNSHSNLA